MAMETGLAVNKAEEDDSRRGVSDQAQAGMG
jgi:hypothetical protein